MTTCLLHGSLSVSALMQWHQTTAENSSRLDAEHFEWAVHACRCNECCILSKADAGRQRRVVVEHLQLLPLLAHIHPTHTHTHTPPVLWLTGASPTGGHVQCPSNFCQRPFPRLTQIHKSTDVIRFGQARSLHLPYSDYTVAICYLARIVHNFPLPTCNQPPVMRKPFPTPICPLYFSNLAADTRLSPHCLSGQSINQVKVNWQLLLQYVLAISILIICIVQTMHN